MAPEITFSKLVEAKQNFGGELQTSRPKIQKVHQFFMQDRERFAKYYQPKLLSFGPIHHRLNLTLGEKYKHMWAAMYVEESSEKDTQLHQKIKDNITELKQLYTEDAIEGYNDDDLSWMLFVDGCALLCYIDCVFACDISKLKIKKDLVDLVAIDMVLLENQLPYKVLKLLKNDVEQMKKSMDLMCMVWDPVTILRKEQSDKPSPEPEQSDKHSPEQEQSDHSVEPQHAVSVSNEEDDPAHFLDYLRNFILARRRPPKHPKLGGCMDFLKNRLDSLRKMIFVNEDSGPRLIRAEYRNIQNLKASGILRMKRDNDAGLVDISFHPHLFAGYLHLPPFMIESWTVVMLYNLTAYESCPDFDNEFEICSFLRFFSWLINCEEDVKELRSARILINTIFGSDAQVIEFFNNISHGLYINPNAYGAIINEMEKYFRSKSKTWIAEAYYTYFRSPWTIIACLGAGIGLLLTSAQTWQGFDPRLG